ncbi:ferritin-like domain-containing protein [Leptolyngbya sp. AN02str]|uniref:ferritin-like domain-containing protein n=1 Tax=Leptolyngbya sp. AN02str TaxID=3423363 RepID=UPI003D32245B
MHLRRLVSSLQEKIALTSITEGMEVCLPGFQSLQERFEKLYPHAQFVTQKFNDLIHLATAESDDSTLQVLQGKVARQHPEGGLVADCSALFSTAN